METESWEDVEGGPISWPMTTAFFIGGVADGHSCPIPAGAELAFVTMVDGQAKTLPRADDPDRDALLGRAYMRWAMFRPVRWLHPSPKGTVGHWVLRPPLLASPLVGQATLITTDLISEVEATLKFRAPGSDSWVTLRQALGERGYILGWED